ncbi:DUF6504 family protein [Streptomyces sp. NPDC092296]|uniref:DUF6504 family protein n=1 Tax=Streptomyces sp. NPDC092296 TaxID=3366012 RepID=UPI0038246336
MTRRHADPVEVRGTGDRPTHFLWRDRIYAVREVLGHWKESGPWWEEARRTTGRPLAAAPVADTRPVPPLSRCVRTEREVWRVEASPGRAFAPGVYDLSLDPAADRWTLTRTTD